MLSVCLFDVDGMFVIVCIYIVLMCLYLQTFFHVDSTSVKLNLDYNRFQQSTRSGRTGSPEHRTSSYDPTKPAVEFGGSLRPKEVIQQTIATNKSVAGKQTRITSIEGLVPTPSVKTSNSNVNDSNVNNLVTSLGTFMQQMEKPR